MIRKKKRCRDKKKKLMKVKSETFKKITKYTKKYIHPYIFYICILKMLDTLGFYFEIEV